MLWLIAIALYLSPLGLLVFFEVYALGARKGWRWMKAAGLCGLPADWFCAAVWLRWLAPSGRTVTARATAGANSALAAIRAGVHPSTESAAALLLASYLNSRDPGHCALT